MSAAVDAELAVDVGEVELDRLDAQEQFGGDVVIAAAPGDRERHLHLLRRERFRGGAFVDLGCGDFRVGRRIAPLAGRYVGCDVVGSLIAPSAGHIYAGKLGTPGLVLRVVSAGVAVAGVNEALKCFGETGSCDHDPEWAGELLVLAGIGYASGILLDIATAGRAVDDYNQRLQLRVTPAVIPTASSGRAVGLGITGSF